MMSEKPNNKNQMTKIKQLKTGFNSTKVAWLIKNEECIINNVFWGDLVLDKVIQENEKIKRIKKWIKIKKHIAHCSKQTAESL